MGALAFFIILLFVYIFMVDTKLSKIKKRISHLERWLGVPPEKTAFDDVGARIAKLNQLARDREGTTRPDGGA